MKKSTLADVVCPAVGAGGVCRGTLALTQEVPLSMFIVEKTQDSEIVEGVLRCQICASEYPILLGLPVLVPDLLTYLRSNYTAIVSLAAQKQRPLSSGMMHFLEKWEADLPPPNLTYAWNYSTPRTLGVHFCIHFDNMMELVRPSSPLYEMFRAIDGKDLYTTMARMLTPRLSKQHCMVDVGCNVGRLTHDLAPHCDRVYGIDLSFGAALAARQILLGLPDRLTSYELFTDGHVRQRRPLQVQPHSNIDVLVASGLCLPFRDGSVDATFSLNLVDVIYDPRGLLQEMLRLLKPGGILGLATTYSWHYEVPIEGWIGGRKQQTSADGMRKLLGESLKLFADEDEVPWVIHSTAREWSLYLGHCLAGHKKDVAATSQ